MIIFLYGEENYLSAEKLRQIKDKYIGSNSNVNLVELDFSDKVYEFSEVTRDIFALPFLASTRLVIIKNILKDGGKILQEKIAKILGDIPKSTVVVFYEGKMPDKRSVLFKKLLKSASFKEFKKMDISELDKWLKEKIAEKIGKVNFDNRLLPLLKNSGDNLYKLDNEIEKLSLYVVGESDISYEEITKLLTPVTQNNIFSFTEALAQKRKELSIKKLHELLEAGAHDLYILTMIVYQFRTLLIVKNIEEKSGNDNLLRQVSILAKINPYVARKSAIFVKNFSFDRLKKIYEKLLETDINIKNGIIQSPLALDMLVVEICKK